MEDKATLDINQFKYLKKGLKGKSNKDIYFDGRPNSPNLLKPPYIDEIWGPSYQYCSDMTSDYQLFLNDDFKKNAITLKRVDPTQKKTLFNKAISFCVNMLKGGLLIDAKQMYDEYWLAKDGGYETLNKFAAQFCKNVNEVIYDPSANPLFDKNAQPEILIFKNALNDTTFTR